MFTSAAVQKIGSTVLGATRVRIASNETETFPGQKKVHVATMCMSVVSAMSKCLSVDKD